MTGSEHFQAYDHNLRRVLLLDWLHDERLRRNAVASVENRANQPTRAPYWMILARDVESGRICG